MAPCMRVAPRTTSESDARVCMPRSARSGPATDQQPLPHRRLFLIEPEGFASLAAVASDFSDPVAAVRNGGVAAGWGCEGCSGKGSAEGQRGRSSGTPNWTSNADRCSAN